jgi:hypothetical protein
MKGKWGNKVLQAPHKRRRDDKGTKGRGRLVCVGGGGGCAWGIRKERNYWGIMRPDWISRESIYTAKNRTELELWKQGTEFSVSSFSDATCRSPRTHQTPPTPAHWPVSPTMRDTDDIRTATKYISWMHSSKWIHHISSFFMRWGSFIRPICNASWNLKFLHSVYKILRYASSWARWIQYTTCSGKPSNDSDVFREALSTNFCRDINGTD